MSNGRWEEIEISYRDNEGHYCACCGKHVARRLYAVTIDGVERRFCGTDCADLYEWYWLPRYGATQTPERAALL